MMQRKYLVNIAHQKRNMLQEEQRDIDRGKCYKKKVLLKEDGVIKRYLIEEKKWLRTLQ